MKRQTFQFKVEGMAKLIKDVAEKLGFFLSPLKTLINSCWINTCNKRILSIIFPLYILDQNFILPLCVNKASVLHTF